MAPWKATVVLGKLHWNNCIIISLSALTGHYCVPINGNSRNLMETFVILRRNQHQFRGCWANEHAQLMARKMKMCWTVYSLTHTPTNPRREGKQLRSISLATRSWRSQGTVLIVRSGKAKRDAPGTLICASVLLLLQRALNYGATYARPIWYALLTLGGLGSLLLWSQYHWNKVRP